MLTYNKKYYDIDQLFSNMPDYLCNLIYVNKYNMYRNCIPTFGSPYIGYNFKGRLTLFWVKQSKLCIKEQNIPSHNQKSIVQTCQRGDPRLCLYFCVTKLATRFGESRRTFPGIKG